MALKAKHLGTDERLVRHMHTHVKVLIGPVALLLVLAALLGVGLAMMPADWRPYGIWSLVFFVVAAFVVGVVIPFWRWRCDTYTLTTRRIIHRTGIITRNGHDLPLTRINDVAFERSLVDRVLGCGTLKLTTAAEDPVYLRDIPDVERVHVQITELLFGEPEDALTESLEDE